MQLIRDMGQRLGIAAALLGFLWQAKMWWMIPMVATLLLLGLLIVFGTTSGVGPFVYTLF
jgi:presenilin-like A22 family membrane protease